MEKKKNPKGSGVVILIAAVVAAVCVCGVILAMVSVKKNMDKNKPETTVALETQVRNTDTIVQTEPQDAGITESEPAETVMSAGEMPDFNDLLDKFLNSYCDAMSSHDPEFLKPYTTADGDVRKDMSDYVVNKKENEQRLIECSVLSTKYVNDSCYEITSSEKYSIHQYEPSEDLSESEKEYAIQKFGDVGDYNYDMLRVVTFTATYSVVCQKGEWLVDSLVSDYDVLEKQYYQFDRYVKE